MHNNNNNIQEAEEHMDLRKIIKDIQDFRVVTLVCSVCPGLVKASAQPAISVHRPSHGAVRGRYRSYSSQPASSHMGVKAVKQGYSHMTWKERKKIENRKVVSLGGKPPKNQRLPLSVARPMVKKQKEREQKMLQERLILENFGGKLADSSKKRPVGKHKPEDRGLKSSEGHFRNGILNVGHLLSSAPSRDHGTRTSVSITWKKKGGDKKGLW